MHLRVIWAIVRKDALDIWLNKPTLGGLIYPIIMSLVFFLISHLVGNSGTHLLIYNPGNSNLAHVVERAFPNAQVTQAGSAAEVEGAFKENESRKKSSYALGLVLPETFDRDLQAGAHPSLTLYADGKAVNQQTRDLLQTAVANYARAMAIPQPPVTVSTIVVNPPTTTKTSDLMGQLYTPLVLLLSLTVGITFIPMLLLEEKEKKTLRMLLVTPASFRDILIGKLLIVLVFQLAITSVALAIQGGFSGQIPFVLLYIIIGAAFSLSLGLFFGSIFNSASSAGAAGGMVSLVFILGGLFVGPLGQIVGDGPVVKLTRVLPTYYLAEGMLNASQSIGSWSAHLLDISIILGSTIILLAISAWVLRRQSAVLAIV